MSRRRWDDLLRRSRKRAEDARDELDARRGAPPAPGDLFVLPETAELPVEWAILDRDPGPPERLLAVPADTNPLTGSADVEVPAGEPGGPLNLRCRFGVWVEEEEVFIPEQRTGALAPAAVEEARCRWRDLERGEPSASSLALEVDVDPEYQDWLTDTLAPARTALEARSRTSKRPSGGRVLPFPASGIHLLAAALAVACIGLSIWVAMLAQTVDELSGPAFEVLLGEIPLGGDPRSLPAETVEVPPDASRFAVMFVFDRQIEAGRLEIVAADGKVLAGSGLRSVGPLGELTLDLPRRSFPNGRYSARLLSPGGDLLDEVALIVKTAEEPD